MGNKVPWKRSKTCFWKWSTYDKLYTDLECGPQMETFLFSVLFSLLYWFPKFIIKNCKKITFFLNSLLFRSVRASWRVQWLDRCLWSRQSVAPMEPDVFQEWEEDVACGPGPIRIKPVRGHLWNSYYSQVFQMVTQEVQLCEQQFHWGIRHKVALKCCRCLLAFPFLSKPKKGVLFI